jgi:hypothetical protein
VYVGGNPQTRIDPLGLRCTYKESTGQMVCVDDQTGQEYYNETRYSGSGRGLNNPDLQGVPNVGRIPQGSWEWGDRYNSPNTGANTFMMSPLPGNTCFGTARDCDSFRGHGDNADRNQSASQGCIVLPPNRTNIPTGETVDVVP